MPWLVCAGMDWLGWPANVHHSRWCADINLSELMPTTSKGTAHVHLWQRATCCKPSVLWSCSWRTHCTSSLCWNSHKAPAYHSVCQWEVCLISLVPSATGAILASLELSPWNHWLYSRIGHGLLNWIQRGQPLNTHWWSGMVISSQGRRMQWKHLKHTHRLLLCALRNSLIESDVQNLTGEMWDCPCRLQSLQHLWGKTWWLVFWAYIWSFVRQIAICSRHMSQVESQIFRALDWIIQLHSKLSIDLCLTCFDFRCVCSTSSTGSHYHLLSCVLHNSAVPVLNS